MWKVSAWDPGELILARGDNSDLERPMVWLNIQQLHVWTAQSLGQKLKCPLSQIGVAWVTQCSGDQARGLHLTQPATISLISINQNFSECDPQSSWLTLRYSGITDNGNKPMMDTGVCSVGSSTNHQVYRAFLCSVFLIWNHGAAIFISTGMFPPYSLKYRCLRSGKCLFLLLIGFFLRTYGTSPLHKLQWTHFTVCIQCTCGCSFYACWLMLVIRSMHIQLNMSLCIYLDISPCFICKAECALAFLYNQTESVCFYCNMWPTVDST